MSAELRYRCEVTPKLAASAAPQLEQLLVWWTEQVQAGAARRRLLRVLRWVGLAVALAGVAVTAVAIVVTPEAPACRRGGGHGVAFLNAVMPVFVLAATFFGFFPRIAAATRGWVRRRAAAQARRFAEGVARAAPYTAEYAIGAGQVTARVEKLRLVSATPLRRVRRAALARDVACLYGGRFPRYVRRIVWLPGVAEREALCAALRAAGVEVVEPSPSGPDDRGAQNISPNEK